MITEAMWILLLLSFSFALTEKQSLPVVKTHLQKNTVCDSSSEPLWQLLKLTSFDGYQLRYSRFGCHVGTNGSIVLVPGRTESSVEYYETALDYIDQGFSPVYVMDPRGQGFSPRLLPNPHKGHVEDFQHYVLDLDEVVKAAKKDLKSRGAKEDHPLFYTSSSMGGAIGIGYFEHKGKDNPFRAAAIFGAMIRVNYLTFIGKQPTWYNRMIYSEAGAILQAMFYCAMDQCENYAVPKRASDYKAEKHKFKEDHENTMTHSAVRFAIHNYLWNKHSWSRFRKMHYDPNENWKNLQLGGATFGWVLHATKFLVEMRKPKQLSKIKNMPLLIVSGTRDNRIYTPHLDKAPDLRHHEQLCKKLREVNGESACTLMPIEGAFHEIYKEVDYLRAQGLSAAINHFRQHL